MDGLNLDGLSLMAFSTNDVVEAWKESVREAERQKTQKVDVTTYSRIAHTDTYTRVAHVDTYSQTAERNSYSQRAHVNSYSQRARSTRYTQSYSNVAHTNYTLNDPLEMVYCSTKEENNEKEIFNNNHTLRLPACVYWMWERIH